MTGVREFYGRWAGLYDRIATAPFTDAWRRAAARRVAEPGDTVVEMGFGTGANVPFLRERVGPDGRVVGVDLTRPLLDRAAEFVVGMDNVSVVRGDATQPPVCEADTVLGTFVCGLFDDPAAVVADWCDIVGSGGRVALLDATATDRFPGRLVNPLFRAFVSAGTPESDAIDIIRAPFDGGHDDLLTRRVDTARTALTDRTVQRRWEPFALGFVGLLSGRVP